MAGQLYAQVAQGGNAVEQVQGIVAFVDEYGPAAGAIGIEIGWFKLKCCLSRDFHRLGLAGQQLAYPRAGRHHDTLGFGPFAVRADHHGKFAVHLNGCNCIMLTKFEQAARHANGQIHQ